MLKEAKEAALYFGGIAAGLAGAFVTLSGICAIAGIG
tara:strand:- start:3831 stop:3941 length:111 start_codon:yes stop_codon:yes gene_type:complete